MMIWTYFRIDGPLRGESIGHWWFPSRRAIGAELFFVLVVSLYRLLSENTVQLPMIWDIMTFIYFATITHMEITPCFGSAWKSNTDNAEKYCQKWKQDWNIFLGHPGIIEWSLSASLGGLCYERTESRFLWNRFEKVTQSLNNSTAAGKKMMWIHPGGR